MITGTNGTNPFSNELRTCLKEYISLTAGDPFFVLFHLRESTCTKYETCAKLHWFSNFVHFTQRYPFKYYYYILRLYHFKNTVTDNVCYNTFGHVYLLKLVGRKI